MLQGKSMEKMESKERKM